MRRPPPALSAVLITLSAITTVLLGWTIMHPPSPLVGSWPDLAVVALVTVLSTRSKIFYQGLGVTPTLAFETAAVILVGPWWAFWIAQTAMLLDLWLYRQRYTWFQQVFNFAQIVTAFGLGMAVVRWFGGSPDPFDYGSARIISEGHAINAVISEAAIGAVLTRDPVFGGQTRPGLPIAG